MRKIVDVIVPKDKKKGLYRVMFDAGDGKAYPADMTLDSYKLLMLKYSMFDKGVSEKDIETFEELVRDIERDDRSFDDAGEWA